ncbi:Calcium-binding protein 39-like [Plasmodiophora brassicae]
MAFLFGRGKKSPTELVKSTKQLLATFSSGAPAAPVAAAAAADADPGVTKSSEKISANLSAMKLMLYGDGDHEAKPELIEKLVEELFAAELLLDLLRNISKFEFETRKDVAMVFNFLLRRGQHNLAVQYVESHSEVIKLLVEGYEDSDIALNCGMILRECIRHECLNQILLESQDLFFKFFDFVQKTNFDVASDAFATFRQCLTKHKTLSSTFLEQNYDKIIPLYNELIQSPNYVTKRQSLKLLGEILLDKKNYAVMIRYINDPVNLRIMMNLLRVPSKTIQFEAFHVFKVFIANPKKSQPVLDIIVLNRDRLIDFLKTFQSDKDDDQFVEEKNLLLATLSRIEPTTPSSASQPAVDPDPKPQDD